MIIGIVSAFQEVLVREARIGRFVANVEFERALLNGSQADELHFFCPTTAVRGRLQHLFADPIRLRRKPVRFFTFLDLPACLKTFSYTAIHQTDPISYYPALAQVRNRYAPRVPLTMVTHTISYREIISEHFKKLLPGPMPFDAVVATSRTAAEMVQRNLSHLAQGIQKIFGVASSFPGQIARIPLGVDSRVYQPGDPAGARARLRLPSPAFLVLSLARLNYYDKMDLLPLLRLWSEMKNPPGSDPTILILAGSDEIGYGTILQDQIRTMGLENEVFFRPNPDQPTKMDLLAAADVFLSLADNVQETFGLSVIEAQAAGLPVLASDFDGYKDLVDHGQTGFLIPTAWAPDHPVATDLSALLLNNISHLVQSQGTWISFQHLLSHLNSLKRDPALRKTMGQKARERVKELFDWPVVIRSYEELWRRLKREAEEYQGPLTMDRSPFEFKWTDLFGHYPTGNLPGETRLVLTAFGSHYLRTQERPTMYSDITPLLDPDLLKRIVTVVAQGPIPLASIKEKVTGCHPSVLNYHVFWLLKNYFLIPEENPNP